MSDFSLPRLFLIFHFESLSLSFSFFIIIFPHLSSIFSESQTRVYCRARTIYFLPLSLFSFSSRQELENASWDADADRLRLRTSHSSFVADYYRPQRSTMQLQCYHVFPSFRNWTNQVLADGYRNKPPSTPIQPGLAKSNRIRCHLCRQLAVLPTRWFQFFLGRTFYYYFRFFY